MDRPASPNRALPGVRPLLGWSLALLSALLLSPVAASALLHLWAQESAATPSTPPGLIAQPRRSNDPDTLYAARTPADEAPQTDPAPETIALPETAPASIAPAVAIAPTSRAAAPSRPALCAPCRTAAPRAPPTA